MNVQEAAEKLYNHLQGRTWLEDVSFSKYKIYIHWKNNKARYIDFHREEWENYKVEFIKSAKD